MWANPRCPKCNKTNWIDLGDMDDLTTADIDAIQCWKCNHKFLTYPESFDMLKTYFQVNTLEQLLEEVRCEKGEKRPKEYD